MRILSKATSLLFLLTFVFLPAASGAGFDVPAFFGENEEGVYLCGDRFGDALCQRVGGGAPGTQGHLTVTRNDASEQGIELIAFNEPVRATFYSEPRQGGLQVNIDYDGVGVASCTYQYVVGDRFSEPQPCGRAVGGESALFMYILGGGNEADTFALDLGKLCLVDDSGTGETCADKWSGQVGSYEISHSMERPSDLFACEWNDSANGSRGGCVVSSGDTCANGHDPNLAFCETKLSPSDCEGTSDVCVLSTVPETEEEEFEEVGTGIAERVVNFYNWAVSIAGLVALGVIIWGGVEYAASAGNPGRISEAKKWIAGAFGGLAMLVGSYVILAFINPDLTRLDDVFLNPNPEVSSPNLELGTPAERDECREKALKNMPEYSLCSLPGVEQGAVQSSFYPAGINFGDRFCAAFGATTGQTGGRSDLDDGIREIIRTVLLDDFPEKLDPRCQDCQIKWIADKMLLLAAAESGGYNPNFVRFHDDITEFGTDTSGFGCGRKPPCTALWGIFQMKKARDPGEGSEYSFDEGDVQWEEQVTNAIHRLMAPGYGPNYWACAPPIFGPHIPPSCCELMGYEGCNLTCETLPECPQCQVEEEEESRPTPSATGDPNRQND